MWKEIPETFGYLASAKGEIKNRKGKIVKGLSIRSGYKYFTVRMPDGKYKNFAFHRVIAMLFVHGFDPGKQVNHKDGNKLNNTCENLEWVTHSQNIKHAYDTGLKKPAGGRPAKVAA